MKSILKNSVWVLLFACLIHLPMVGLGQTGDGGGRKSLVDGNNSFCFDLYRQLKDEDGNLFFSPYSISTALAMTYVGAGGKTAKEMADVLHFELPQESLHTAFFILSSHMKKIRGNGNVVLTNANALWIQKSFPLKQVFLDVTRSYYDASPFPVDFLQAGALEQTRLKINRWVKDKTGGKIRDLIAPGILTSLTRLVLTNAIYFKGDWATQFDRSKTQTAPFRVSPRKSVDVPMMDVQSTFTYKEDDNCRVLEMPYKGKEISMLILLPREAFGLEKVERVLMDGHLSDLTSGMRPRKVRVYFPKFKMTCEFELKKTLIAMGMSSAFNDSADFSGMSAEALLIHEVIHKAFVEVHEEGAEAAAGTAVVMRKKGPPPQKPVLFRADFPFIFLIKDNATDSVLFMGRVSDPS